MRPIKTFVVAMIVLCLWGVSASRASAATVNITVIVLDAWFNPTPNVDMVLTNQDAAGRLTYSFATTGADGSCVLVCQKDVASRISGVTEDGKQQVPIYVETANTNDASHTVVLHLSAASGG